MKRPTVSYSPDLVDAAGRPEETEALRAEIADAINQGQVVAERPPAVWH